ncbi:hypothetical protein FACS189411_15310 [Bacteroidia bacterium]|nr:hypothetical protein FACS189411_15310 [Bacteroidia bacterium]
MSTEFIIGTAISVVSVITGVMALPQVTKSKFFLFNKSGQQLIDLLVKEHHNTVEQRRILRAINKKLSAKFEEKIPKHFIDNFTVNVNGKEGKEAIVRKILFENGIYPITGICKELLGYDSLAFRNEWFSTSKGEDNKNKTSELITNEDMSNTVFLSELLMNRYPKTCKTLIDILSKHNISHKFIKATKDIWCRDYMPIPSANGKLVQFRYDPSSLKGKEEWEASRSDPKEICRVNGINTHSSDINLDGGNVLRCSDRVIISDRVYYENPEYTDKAVLIADIKSLLEVNEIIVIPSQKSDLTGHADGMVRFVDRDTILGNDRKLDFRNWADGINRVLTKHHLKYIDIPFFEYRDRNHPYNAVGIYVNYLEIKNLIVLPIFEVPDNKDNEVVELFKKIFPDRAIETINYTDVALEGGLLNCTTWTLN